MPEPRPLSSEYHKARKQLMLWAALLFIWELVGIDLKKAESADGNVGAIVRAIKSPQAVPWVLLALILYFLFKFSVEWAQCHSERRKLAVARIDFVSAWIVSVIAIALYIGQSISRVQLADRLRSAPNFARVVFVIPLMILLIIKAALGLTRRTHRLERPARMLEIVFGAISIFLAVILTNFGSLNWKVTLTLFTAGVLLLTSDILWTLWVTFYRKSEMLHEAKSYSSVARAYTFASLYSFSLKDRILIRAADLTFFIAIKLIGKTVKFEVDGWENWEAATKDDRIPIYTFWHDRVFLSTYFWQRRGIVVMTSRSFDGEYIARFIQRFGYGAARGSSSRGATGAIVEMVRLMRSGCPTAFTIDGPRGPRYEAKMGSVLLAKKTGFPILPFTIAVKSFWEAKSWDRTQVPKPFTRAKVYIAPPIFVSSEAGDEELQSKRNELQQTLDEINQRGEEWRANL